MPLPWLARLSTRSSVRCEQLPERYLTGLYRFAAVRLGPGPDAEDVAAETLAAAVEGWSKRPRRAPTSPDDDPLRAWLYGIARRKVVDALRQRERLTKPVPATVDPSDRETALSLAAVLAEIPDDQREALLLKYVDGLTLEEIATVLERTPAAVGSLLHRARASARERGKGFFGEEDR